MTHLTQAEREKLAKLLALLGSDHAGECAAAASAAHRLQQRSGLSWRQILDPPPVEKPLPELGTWRATCTACLHHRGSLRAWEVEFLTDLPRFRRLSTKQDAILQGIAERLSVREAT